MLKTDGPKTRLTQLVNMNRVPDSQSIPHRTGPILWTAATSGLSLYLRRTKNLRVDFRRATPNLFSSDLHCTFLPNTPVHIPTSSSSNLVILSAKRKTLEITLFCRRVTGDTHNAILPMMDYRSQWSNTWSQMYLRADHAHNLWQFPTTMWPCFQAKQEHFASNAMA